MSTYTIVVSCEWNHQEDYTVIWQSLLKADHTRYVDASVSLDGDVWQIKQQKKEPFGVIYGVKIGKDCIKMCQFNLFSLTVCAKAFDIHGVSEHEICPGATAAESLWTTKACRHVNHTHGCNSKKCRRTDGVTHTHIFDKKKYFKKAYAHVLKVLKSCAQRDTLMTRCGSHHKWLQRGLLWQHQYITTMEIHSCSPYNWVQTSERNLITRRYLKKIMACKFYPIPSYFHK